MRKIFIDCGAYKGEVTKAFLANRGEGFEVFAFEPNPYAKIHKKNVDYTVFQKAVWITDGRIPFYINKKKARSSQSSSLLKEKTSGGLDTKILVEAVNFGKWVKDNFSKDDFIVVKMDIEGAEFRVVDSMVADGSIYYIDELYMESHAHCIGLPDSARIELNEKLSKIDGLVLRDEFIYAEGLRK